MNWALVKLSKVVEIKGGGTPSKKVEEYWGGDIPWASVKDFKSTVLDSAIDSITQLGVDNSATNVIPAGSIVVPTRMAVGKVATLSIDMAINQDLKALIVKDENELDKRYLLRFLESQASYILKHAKGATVKGITLDVLRDLEIPLPYPEDPEKSLKEQKRIAAILDKADGIRRKRKQAIQLADDFLRSVFLDMFGDPVTNPKGFQIKKLSDFYNDPKTGTKCGPFGSALKKNEFQSDGIPVWNMDNISLDGRFIDSPSLWVSEEKYNNINTYNVNQGDVIISRAGTVGKMGVVKSQYSKSLISTNLIRVRFGDLLLPEYFVSLMVYCKGRIGRLKTGPDGAFTHMNTGILDSLEFPYPPIKLQKEFLEVIDRVRGFKIKSSNSLNELNENFVSLSQKAFKGEL